MPANIFNLEKCHSLFLNILDHGVACQYVRSKFDNIDALASSPIHKPSTAEASIIA